MATIPSGSVVRLAKGEAEKLAHPPPALDRTPDLQVVVHPRAVFEGPQASRLTTVLHRREGGIIDWVGSIDERMLAPGSSPGKCPRGELRSLLFNSKKCLQAIFPELLIREGYPNPYLTVYGGARPWIVIGCLKGGVWLAAPLNDVQGNPKKYAPPIAADELDLRNAKPSQLELPHIWSLRASSQPCVKPPARERLKREILAYFDA